MKIKEIRQKNRKELNELLSESRRKLGQLKFDLSSKKLKNVNQIKGIKREIAQILTVLKEEK